MLVFPDPWLAGAPGGSLLTVDFDISRELFLHAAQMVCCPGERAGESTRSLTAPCKWYRLPLPLSRRPLGEAWELGVQTLSQVGRRSLLLLRKELVKTI